MTPSDRPPIDNYFVCIGAQKAGTTWLARVLSRHPDVFVTPVKEIHYFDHVRGVTQHLADRKRRSRLRKHYQRLLTQWGRLSELKAQNGWYARYMADPIDDAWYASLFADRLGRRIAGEATPEYAILGTDGLEHIRRLAPEARVIYIMRNPVRQAWSQLLHQCRVRKLDARKLGEAQMRDILGEERMRALANYPRTLADLGAVFPRSQILTLIYEEIHADRMKAIANVSQFIGARFEATWFKGLDERHNKSQDVALPASFRPYLQEATRTLATGAATALGRMPKAWAEEYGIGD